jgi:hypothetical protein
VSVAQRLTVYFCDPFYCPTCGVPVSIPAEIYRQRRENGSSYYCCNGHSMVARKSDVQKLKEELAEKERSLAAAKARADMAEASARAHKGKVTEIKNRVANGVCPCCNRSFQSLHRHMKTKHPEFKE